MSSTARSPGSKLRRVPPVLDWHPHPDGSMVSGIGEGDGCELCDLAYAWVERFGQPSAKPRSFRLEDALAFDEAEPADAPEPPEPMLAPKGPRIEFGSLSYGTRRPTRKAKPEMEDDAARRPRLRQSSVRRA